MMKRLQQLSLIASLFVHYFICRCALDLTWHNVLVCFHAICLHQLVFFGTQRSLFCAIYPLLSTWVCALPVGLTPQSWDVVMLIMQVEYAGSVETRKLTTGYVLLRSSLCVVSWSDRVGVLMCFKLTFGKPDPHLSSCVLYVYLHYSDFLRWLEQLVFLDHFNLKRLCRVTWVHSFSPCERMYCIVVDNGASRAAEVQFTVSSCAIC